MIEWRLSVLMAQRRLKTKDLVAISGLSEGVIKKLRPRETIDQINIKTLNALCNALKCGTNDLMPHTPDAPEQDQEK